MSKDIADQLLAESHQKMGSVHALISAGQPDRAHGFVEDAVAVSQVAGQHYDLGFGSAENYPTTETQGATGTSPDHEAVHVHEESHASSAIPGSGTELEEE